MTDATNAQNPEEPGQDPLEEAFAAPDATEAPEAEGNGAEGDGQQESAAEGTDAAGSSPEGAGSGAGAEQLANERLEDLRRLQAEFVNYRNRTAREKDQLRDYVTGDLISALLPVIDDIDAARQAGDLEDGPFAKIAEKLTEALSKQGLEQYGEAGDKFDPRFHEAVMQQPTSEVEPDHLATVFRSGYKVKDRVLRAAQVAVAVAES